MMIMMMIVVKHVDALKFALTSQQLIVFCFMIIYNHNYYMMIMMIIVVKQVDALKLREDIR